MSSRRALTPKMARFCALVAGGQHLNEAYRRSYRAEHMKDVSVRVESSKLARLPHVAEAITNLRARHEPTERTVEVLEADWVLLRLQEAAVTVLATPAPGEPPIIITQSGNLLRVVPE
jgi:hypothetical protein